MGAYSKKREKNSSYSLRAFSKLIGVSSGALSEIIQNKRTVTHTTATKVLRSLNWNENEISDFLNEIKSKDKVKRDYQNLALDQYQVLSQWYYLALLNLIELPGEDHTNENLAQRLNLSVAVVEEAIERMLKLEMIETKDGGYKRTHIRYKTTDDVTSSAIRRYHLDTLELSEKALREIPTEERDFSSILLQMNPKHLKKVKEMILNFQDEVSDEVDHDDQTEIYHLNVHLYPITNLRKE